MGLLELAGAATQAVVEVLLVASFGAYIAWKGVFPKPSIKVIDKLVVEIMTPCLIMGKVTPQVKPDVLAELWPLMSVCVWNMFWGLLIGYFLSIVLKQPKLRGVLQAAVAFPNTVSVVLTLSQALSRTKQVQDLSGYPAEEAEEKLFARASLLVLTSTLWWNFARWTVAYNLLAGGEPQTLAERAKKVFNPPVMACGLSFFIGFIPPFREWWVGDTTPAVLVTTAVNMIGRCTVPVVLIVLGARVLHSAKDIWASRKQSTREQPEVNLEVSLTEMQENPQEMASEKSQEAIEEGDVPIEVVESDAVDLTMKAKLCIIASRQVVCLLLGLVLTYFVSFTTDDVMLLIVCFLQTAGPPMINLTVMAGLHGCFEEGIAHTLLMAYLGSIVSWLVGISLCLQLLDTVLSPRAEDVTITATVLL